MFFCFVCSILRRDWYERHLRRKFLILFFKHTIFILPFEWLADEEKNLSILCENDRNNNNSRVENVLKVTVIRDKNRIQDRQWCTLFFFCSRECDIDDYDSLFPPVFFSCYKLKSVEWIVNTTTGKNFQTISITTWKSKIDRVK